MRKIHERSERARQADQRDRERFAKRTGRGQISRWLADEMASNVPSWQRDRATLAFHAGIAEVIQTMKMARSVDDVLAVEDLDQLVDRIAAKAKPAVKAAIRKKLRKEAAGLERKFRAHARPIHHRSTLNRRLDHFISKFDHAAGAKFGKA